MILLPRLNIFTTPEDLATQAARDLMQLAGQSIDKNGFFAVALAGGSTPKILYHELALLRDHTDWRFWRFYFGDERAVGPDDPQSNFRMARDTLFDNIPITHHQVARMQGELEPLSRAAVEYEFQLDDLLPADRPGHPVFDLVLLGMGDDGHTASLFPNSPVLNEEERWVAETPAPYENTLKRLTLTFPVINAARHVWIMVTGENKAERVRDVHDQYGLPAEDSNLFPIARVRPNNGELVWFLDQAAVNELD